MRPPMKPLKPLDDALADLLAKASPLRNTDADTDTDTDTVITFDADGRVLAQDCVSALQVPPNDNSSMDGYAVRCADVMAAGVRLPVSQRIAAGSVGGPLQPGTAARIFTGAPIPEGADAVLMQEDCEALPAVAGDGMGLQRSDGGDGGDRGLGGLGDVRINVVPRPGQWVRRAGEDITRGAVVLQAGTRLTPAELGLAASIGLHQLQVARRPRVALFSTGDELVMPGDVPPEQMRPGAIYNSNRFFLRALLLRLGCEVTDFGIVPDRRDATIEALRQASSAHDLILTSGGVSVGEEDHIKPAVESLGSLDLWQIAMKPGKPFAYGQIPRAHGADARPGAAHFMGLPGNPVSSFMTVVMLVRPFVLRLQGVLDVAPQSIAARADFTWPKADKRREFLRVRHNAAGGLDLFSNQSSGVLTSAAWGDGVVDNPAGQTIGAGDTVRFIAFSELLA